MPKEYEGVEATLQHDTTPDASQQKRKWHAIDWIVGATFGLELLLIIGWSIAQVTGWNPDISSEHFAQFYFAWGLGFLSLGYIVLILCPIFKKDDDPRWFHARILSSGIVGGSYAFLLPVVMSLPEGSINSGGAAALRQAILLATGGLIGLIALGETRRKNDNDREAAESLRIHQQGTLIQQKDQFDANAFKDRKAERRERYTKAVEQLGDEKAPVRMGGVYTLVGLVDEWLEEESIRKYEDRLKEGQVIINNLCAYIRSPFTLASHYDELMQDTPDAEGVYQDKVQEFYADKATLDSEADVRLGIIKEIHDRLQGSEENTPGIWSDFEYNFSRSTFFYSVDFTKSYYKKLVNFSNSTYKNQANFNGSIYQHKADFSYSLYKNKADFSYSLYKNNIYFKNSLYEDKVTFKNSIYKPPEKCKNTVDFSNSIYIKDANFSHIECDSTALFESSTYCDEVNFNYSNYNQTVDLGKSIYKEIVNIKSSKYNDSTVFIGSIFYNPIYFGAYTDLNLESEPISCFKATPPDFYFEYAYDKSDLEGPGYRDKYLEEKYEIDYEYTEIHKIRTLFGSRDNNFELDEYSGCPITLTPKHLPSGCRFLTSDQREYFKGKFQEIDETKNKLLEVKDPKEKEELLKKLRSLNEELHKWREEVTTVKVEDVVAEDTES